MQKYKRLEDEERPIEAYSPSIRRGSSLSPISALPTDILLHSMLTFVLITK
jgi:hypothetical protein